MAASGVRARSLRLLSTAGPEYLRVGRKSQSAIHFFAARSATSPSHSERVTFCDEFTGGELELPRGTDDVAISFSPRFDVSGTARRNSEPGARRGSCATISNWRADL